MGLIGDESLIRKNFIEGTNEHIDHRSIAADSNLVLFFLQIEVKVLIFMTFAVSSHSKHLLQVFKLIYLINLNTEFSTDAH